MSIETVTAFDPAGWNLKKLISTDNIPCSLPWIVFMISHNVAKSNCFCLTHLNPFNFSF
jgi:hypothetical protein